MSSSGFSRRRLLTGTAAATAGALAGGALLSASDEGSASRADAESTAAATRIAFEGRHQSGITTPPPRHAIIAAFDVTASDRDELAAMLRAATGTVRDLMAGVSAPARSKLLPPVDNLILGVEPPPEDLTVTFGVGASLFDDRYGLSDRRPKQLVAMPAFPNDEPHDEQSHGDVLLQVCASTPEGCNHALRRVMRVTRDSLTLRWMLPGFQDPNTLGPGRASGRNLMGFKDGTANPTNSDTTLMDELVWVAESDREPAWAVDGSYMVVRRIRMRVEFWDRTALHTQEAIIGRLKDTGAPLDGVYETDAPSYTSDPDGARTPLTAHIRLANPRTDETEKNRILRRGFNFSQGFTPDGQLDQGLLFVCFQRNLADGFMSVQARLDGEALEEYIKPVGGGFFYALPGVQGPYGYLGESMLS